MKTLRNRVVVITGAASGIGRALACEAAKRGSILALLDSDEAGLAKTMALLGRQHECRKERLVDHLSCRVDVRSESEVALFAAAVQRVFGGAHVVVNNAGVSLSDFVGSMDRSDFEWLFDINFWGTVRCTDAFLPQLVARDDAHFVNISSVFGLVAVPSQAAYCASKFAVRGFTEALRQELEGTSVRVTCVHPGGVTTNIVRNGRHRRNWRNEATTAEAVAIEFGGTARTSPEAAARTIWAGVLADSPRVLIGLDARLLDLLQRAFPSGYPSLLRALRRRVDSALGR